MPPSAADDPIARELSRLGYVTTGLPPSTAREVRMLVDGHAKYTALLADIAQARDSIDIEYYIFLPDRTGTAMRDALVERARAGVRVRLLVDAVGSSKTPRKFFAPLVEAGGLVAWFHPMRLGRFWRRPWLNLRTHRKIAVIDGHIAYTGGINVTDEEDESLRPDAYRDLHLRLEGRIARSLQVLFVEDWAYATGASADPAARARGDASPGRMRCRRSHRGRIRIGRRSTACSSPRFIRRNGACG